jgi:polyisoprenyl-teichoic acid--peptidoglycan teichoic acid transferase
MILIYVTIMADIKKTTPNKKRKFFSKLFSFLIISTLLIFLLFQVAIGTGWASVFTNATGLFEGFNPLAFVTGQTKVKGEDEGRTNILLFGINETDGDGKGAVDTNIIISYFYKEKKISTVSIQRDILVNGYGKINNVYKDIQGENQGKSLQYINEQYQKEMSGLLGIDIHYNVKINMTASKAIVDAIGGITIDVPYTFYDNEYPKFRDYNKVYCPSRNAYDDFMCPAPKFEKGVEQMNGDRALIYARSRHGICITIDKNGKENRFDVGCVENGDQARGRRQQMVIQALLTKIKSEFATKGLDVNFINSILQPVAENVKISINANEMISLFKNIKDNVDASKIKKVTISYLDTKLTNKIDSSNNLLCTVSDTSDIQFCDGSSVSDSIGSSYNKRFKEIFQKPLEEIEDTEEEITNTTNTTVPSKKP